MDGNQIQKKRRKKEPCHEDKFDLSRMGRPIRLQEWGKGEQWELGFEDQTVWCFLGQAKETGFYSVCDGVSWQLL